MNLAISLAIGVLASTATTDASVLHGGRGGTPPRRTGARSGTLLSAFAVISYTENPVYVTFAAAGYRGSFNSMTWLHRAANP